MAIRLQDWVSRNLLSILPADTWSRRIDLEHRLVYKVTGNKVYFLQARYHYQSG
jgi:toxin YoeB